MNDIINSVGFVNDNKPKLLLTGYQTETETETNTILSLILTENTAKAKHRKNLNKIRTLV